MADNKKLYASVESFCLKAVIYLTVIYITITCSIALKL